jgi:hypothetical protein
VKRGRPSYESRARRHGEIGEPIDNKLYQSLMAHIEAMNANEHIVIPANKVNQIKLNSLRKRLYRYNDDYGTNFKVHVHTDKSVYVWLCPDPPTPSQYTHSTAPITPQTSGSIHAPLFAVLQHLNMTREAFEQLPFDRQMTLRINAGIALRDERTRRAKLGHVFKHPNADS